MTGSTITMSGLGGFYPMEAMNRKCDTTLGAWTLRG